MMTPGDGRTTYHGNRSGSGRERSAGARFSRRRVLLAVLPLLVIAPAAAVYYDFEVRSNFAEVVPGKLYRAGQPGEAQLERWILAYGLKGILDLRHSVPDYERALAARHGVRLFHVPISAERGLPEEVWLEIRGILTDEENLPLVIHCRSGADRTGLVAARYRVEVQGWPLEDALREMRRRYHFPSRYPRPQEQLRELYGGDAGGARRPSP